MTLNSHRGRLEFAGILAAAVVGVCAAGAWGATAEYNVIDITPSFGQTVMNPAGLGDNGYVAGSYVDGNGNLIPFLSSLETQVSFDTVFGQHDFGFSGISSGGSYTSVYQTGPGNYDHAYVVENATAAASEIHPITGYQGIEARSANDAGAAAGALIHYTQGPSVYSAMVRSSSGAVTDLGAVLGTNTSEAWYINNAGQVVGLSSNAGFDTARIFLYDTTTGGKRDVSTLAESASGKTGYQFFPLALSSGGLVAGEADAYDSNFNLTDYYDFIYNSKTNVTTILGKNFTPSAINDAGVSVGTAPEAGTGHFVAAIREGATVRNLNDLVSSNIAGTLRHAEGVNNNGQIVATSGEEDIDPVTGADTVLGDFTKMYLLSPITSRTDTNVVPLGASTVGVSGGAAVVNGVSAHFGSVTTPGTFTGDSFELTPADFAEAGIPLTFVPALTSDGNVVALELDFDGEASGVVTVTFHFDPSLYPQGTDFSAFRFYHFDGSGTWVLLNNQSVDLVNDLLTADTPSFSPFAVGLAPVATPEPATMAVLGLAGLGLIQRRRSVC